MNKSNLEGSVKKRKSIGANKSIKNKSFSTPKTPGGNKNLKQTFKSTPKRKGKTQSSPEVELGLKLEALLDKSIKAGKLSPGSLISQPNTKTPKILKRKSSTPINGNTPKWNIDISQNMGSWGEKFGDKESSKETTPASNKSSPLSKSTPKFTPGKKTNKKLSSPMISKLNKSRKQKGKRSLSVENDCLPSPTNEIKNVEKDSINSKSFVTKGTNLKINVKKNQGANNTNQKMDDISGIEFNQTEGKQVVTKGKKKKGKGQKISETLNDIPENIEKIECGTENVGGPDRPLLNADKVLEAVKSVFKLLAKKLEPGVSSEKKNLFDNVPKLIRAQINTIKNPETPKKFIRISLEHQILPKDADICLITGDIKGKRSDPDVAIEYYTELLKTNNIDYIKEIIPIKKLKTEYTEHEQKRKLSCQFDLFLVEAKIVHRAISFIGKHFYRNHRIPVPVPIGKGVDMKVNIEKAIRKCTIILGDHSNNSFTTEIGNTQQTEEEIVDNVLLLASGIDNFFPGGWKNIRSLNLWADKSVIIPVYYSALSPNKVQRPIVKNIRKEPLPVSGELSTIPGATVVVHPSGRVVVKKHKLEDDSDDDMRKKNKRAKKVKGVESEEPENEDSEEEEMVKEEVESNDEIGGDDNEENDSEGEDIEVEEEHGISEGEDSDDNDEISENDSEQNDTDIEDEISEDDISEDDEVSEDEEEVEESTKPKSTSNKSKEREESDDDSDEELITKEEEMFLQNWEQEFLQKHSKKKESKWEGEMSAAGDKGNIMKELKKIEKTQKKIQTQMAKSSKKNSKWNVQLID